MRTVPAFMQPVLCGGHQQQGLRPGTEAVGEALALASALEDAANPAKLGERQALYHRLARAVWETLLPHVVSGLVLPTGPAWPFSRGGLPGAALRARVPTPPLGPHRELLRPGGAPEGNHCRPGGGQWIQAECCGNSARPSWFPGAAPARRTWCCPRTSWWQCRPPLPSTGRKGDHSSPSIHPGECAHLLLAHEHRPGGRRDPMPGPQTTAEFTGGVRSVPFARWRCAGTRPKKPAGPPAPVVLGRGGRWPPCHPDRGPHRPRRQGRCALQTDDTSPADPRGPR